jgi:glycosyltransferase involved in cell wall biosynthesis
VDDVTICVSTFLRDHCLYRCIDSIREHYPEIRVLVADDGQLSDEKTEWLASRQVDYLTLPFDSGLAAKRNLLVDSVATDYLVMMDDDMVLTPEAQLPKLRALMEVADLAAAKLYYADKGKERDYLARMHLSGRRLELLPLRSPWAKHRGIAYRRTHLALNCFMAKTKMLSAIRWDDRFKITYEHMDSFVRMWLAGVVAVYTPESEFTEYRDRTQEYKPYRRRKEEAEKTFFAKWGFSTIYKHPSLNHRPVKATRG